MPQTYFKLAYRSILKDKAYSAINITGLAIGLASSILILLWVQNELSFDRFHSNSDRTYRITVSIGEEFNAALSPAGMPAGLEAELPVIKNTTRLSSVKTVLLDAGNKKFEEKRVFYADPGFMDVFSFPLVKGNRATALTNTDAVVITQEIATKYFGDEDPIGKVMQIDNKESVVVTGVLATIPANSHLQFDILLPMASLARTDNGLQSNSWDDFSFYSYVQLDNSFDPSAANVADLEKQVNEVFHKHNPGMTGQFQLQSLNTIHLAPEKLGDVAGHGNAQYVSIFFIIAILILVVACINFMNLATARSARRAKEIGLRKTAGAVRGQLVIQFLTESVFISFASLLLALAMVSMLLPLFNELSDRNLSINTSDVTFWVSLISITLLTGLISGSYPALFLSGFNPIKVLRGNVKSMGGNLLFRNAMVVTQFVVSIVLLIGTVVIYNQLTFIQQRNPGFEKANLLYVPLKGDMGSNVQALKNELRQSALTDNFTITSDLPTNLSNASGAEWEGKDASLQIAIPRMAVNEDFISVFKIQLLSGRSFLESTSDSANYVVNEKMINVMGLSPTAAIGQRLTLQGVKGTIIGVVKDFNFKPVQQAIEPLVMSYNRSGGFVVVRTLPGKTNATIEALASISKKLNPGYPFQFDFLDQELANLYKGEQQMGNIFNLFAALGIFISCLGLYGLSAFLAEQRTKEIGVRKVLGASVFNLAYLLSSGITRLVLIAIVIAIPFSWYAVNSWLSSFAYHIDVTWLVFASAALAALGIAWITVSYESIKAAIANPIKSLRTE